MGQVVQLRSAVVARLTALALLCASFAACSGVSERLAHFKGPNWPFSASVGSAVHQHNTDGYRASAPGLPGHLRPRIEVSARPLQCVPYARRHAGIGIRGDAWTWWGQAEGRYQRGSRPEIGAILALRRRGRSRGHLAVVTEIVDSRTIVVRHANWLNEGRIHLDTPVRDVSGNNDWSAVRLWYTPGGVYGASTYPAYGFIYPRTETAAR